MIPVLTSWKDIAKYLGKGVRTAQRWEAELGLPVRRPKQEGKSVILAIPEEIDAWVNSHACREPGDSKRTLKQLSIENKRLRRKLAWVSELTPSELSTIEAAAKANNQSVPEWIRSTLKRQAIKSL